jgi:ribonuclease BN (tRNA processing enzyme)
VRGNNEVEDMTGATRNVQLDGHGVLRIIALGHGRSWTSGRIQTRRYFRAPAGGLLRVTASIRQPDPASGQGYWPAFWLLGPGSWPQHSEIDILEDVNGLSRHSGTLHCGNLTARNPDGTTGSCHEPAGLGTSLLRCTGCQQRFHTYTTSASPPAASSPWPARHGLAWVTMRLTVAGCSGSMPGPDSPASCYLLEADGFRLVLDLGNGAIGALQRYASLDSIDAVCLSHLHADHCLDLCPYYVASTYAPGGPLPPVPVYGPAGTAERVAQAYAHAGPPELARAFSFRTLTGGTREIGPFRVTAARMNHPVETYGFRLEAAGRVLAYSADTGETGALTRLAGEADLLLCEASFQEGPDLPADLHLTARQAAGHAARAGAARLMITHVPPWYDPVRSLEEASAVAYGGPVSLAAPGQSFDVG